MLTIDRVTPLMASSNPQRAVHYSCTALFENAGTKRSQLLDWDLLATTGDAFKKIRRAAVGVTQVLDERANEGLRAWLLDRDAFAALEAALGAGRTYELELRGATARMVLVARGVTALPMVDRLSASCPALMLRGRRLWAEQRERATVAPTETGRSPGQGRVDQVLSAPTRQI